MNFLNRIWRKISSFCARLLRSLFHFKGGVHRYVLRYYLLSILVLSLFLGSILFYWSWLKSSVSRLSPVTLYCLENKDDTICRGRFLRYTSLKNRKIKDIIFKKCFCKNTYLFNVEVSDSDFRDSRFDRSYIKNSSFVDVDLFKASFYGAILDNVVFEKSELTGVLFNFATVRNVYFKNVDLSSTVFIGTRFENAYYDKNTKLPFSREQASRMGFLLK